jgi:hypothetical protein
LRALLRLGHKMAPKAHVLKAWSPTGGAVGRWLDHEGSSSMGWSIDEFILNGLLGGGAWLEKAGHWRHCLWRVCLVPVSSYLSLYFLAAVRWAAFLCHTILPWYTASPLAQKHKWPCSQVAMDWDLLNGKPKYIFPTFKLFSQVFCHMNKKTDLPQLRRDMEDTKNKTQMNI